MLLPFNPARSRCSTPERNDEVSVPTVDVEKTARVDEAHWKNLRAYLLYRRHAFAYESALLRSKPGGTWLDIGCGMGYALDRLADHAHRVLAVDLAWKPLRDLPSGPKLEKARTDATALPLGDASVDHVTCFQVIEHVERDLALRILQEIRRVLKPSGLGFVTTPNARWRLLPGQRPWNPYHVREYDPAGIAELCAEAGLQQGAIQGVVGLEGAQEVEQARVSKNPFLVWGPHHPRAWSQWRNLARPPGRRAGRRLGRRAVSETDKNRTWFTLEPEHAEGLDFWVEITGHPDAGA